MYIYIYATTRSFKSGNSRELVDVALLLAYTQTSLYVWEFQLDPDVGQGQVEPGSMEGFPPEPAYYRQELSRQGW